MKSPDQEQLLAYVYGETDKATTKAIEQHLASNAEDRTQVAEWRSTMGLLDAWTLDELPAKSVTVFPRVWQVAKIAAVVAVLVGAGVMLGRQLNQAGGGQDVLANNVDSQPVDQVVVNELVEAQVQAKLTEERLKLIAQQQEIEEQLLMASASSTHQQAQGYVLKALDHLDRHEMRNELLALLLPAEEQAAYESKRDGLKAVASNVERETARQQQYVQQIIARARARAISKAH